MQTIRSTGGKRSRLVLQPFQRLTSFRYRADKDADSKVLANAVHRPTLTLIRRPGGLGSLGESSVASRRKRGPVALRP